jgi:hypothetical protein
MNKLLVALAFVFAACGGGGSLSIDEYPQEFREAFCKNFVKCGVVKDLQSCRALNFGVDLHLSGTALAAFDSDKAKFDGGKAQSCVDAIADSSCDLTDESQRVLPEVCDEIASGTLHAGDACTVGAQCISQRCTIQNCGMACCPGTCSGDAAPVIAKVGESCQRSRCTTGTFCNNVNAICTALKPAGSTCSFQSECDYGTACIGAGETGICTKLPHLGEACTDFCTDFGSICDPTSHICVKVVLAGEACLGQGEASNCSPLFTCDAGRCSAGIALGATCAADDHCADDRAFCDVADGALTGTCVLPKANGMPCQLDPDCDSVFCDFDTSRCVEEPVCR